MKRVDCSIGTLTDVDDAFEVHVAGIVFTIGEEQDKISGGGMIRSTFRSSDGPLKSGKQTALPTFQQPLLLECYKSSTELSLHLEFVPAHPGFLCNSKTTGK